MSATFYYVQRGDTLWKISRRFGTTVQAITKANIICNPNLIYPGEAFIIPDPNLPLPRAGGLPYYVVRPGDSLWCLAREFNTTVNILAASNHIRDPNRIYAGQELIVIGERPNPRELQAQWENLGGWPSCDIIPPISIHGIYYNGSFLWETLGRLALPYLLPLLKDSCDIVRVYTIISLARIGSNGTVKAALRQMLEDPSPTVRALIPLALRRIDLVEAGKKNVHLVSDSIPLHQEPNLASPSAPLPVGTEVTAVKWFIPSPTGEEGPRGGIQIYDQVKVVTTGKVGFIPRVGFDETVLI